MQNLINVSNRLPVTVGEKIAKSSGGLVAALEGVTIDGGQLKWIGWPGTAIAEAAERERLDRQLESEYGFAPVFLDDDEVEAFYEGFSNSTLWPLLHYMPSKFCYQPQWWDAYQAVNRKFAEKVLEVAQADDLVWVHDYQLMLLPGMLREHMPGLRIGFFLHTPFPSYEVFRCHPRRSELVRGVLGADLVGFHTVGYMRHFRSAVLRLLGIESEMTRIRHGGHGTSIGVYPIGIYAKKFGEQLATRSHAEQVAKLAMEHQDKPIVLSVERMDYTKGIVHRLDAIEMYLRDHEEDRERVKFLFVSVPSREGVKEYQRLREEVEQRVGQINGKFATIRNSPIHFIHASVTFEELCALYALARVAIVTPLADGMNLVAKEYVACQADQPGVLILSEFAGAAEELFDALIVNPYDAQAVADAISRALSMDSGERRARMASMRQRVMEFDALWWAGAFIADLKRTEPLAEEMESIAYACQRLSAALSDGGPVGLFLDYDGTLREIEREPQSAFPGPPVTSLLRRIAQRPDIELTIISGRTPRDLEHWFGGYPFGLIAEHGASFRRPGQREWENLDHAISYAWKRDILPLLKQFEVHTPGSFVEEKRTSLVWHYRKADPEFGEWKARQLAGELAVLAANEAVQIRQGNKIVEIVPNAISKGTAVRNILATQDYQLVICAGDDQTDESMFALEHPGLLSIKVGSGETIAKVRMSSPTQLRRFLDGALASEPVVSPAR